MNRQQNLCPGGTDILAREEIMKSLNSLWADDKCVQKKKKKFAQGREGPIVGLVFAILNRVVGAGLPEKVILEERLEGVERGNCVAM